MSGFTSPSFFRTVDLLDVSADAPNDGQALVFDAATGQWGPATISSGSEGATSLSELSDVSAAASTANFVLATPDGSSGDYSGRALVADDLPSHTHAASDIVSGTFDDARISESSVTQHESALTITESQISDLGAYITDLSGFDTDDLSEGATNLYYTDQRVDDRVLELLTEGSGISIYENTDGTLTISTTGDIATSLTDLDDVTITSIASGEILKWSGSAWINNTLSEAGVSAVGHTHSTSDITSGTLPITRGGTGSGFLNVPVNYTATGSTIRGHLEGIDNALGDKIEDLSGFDTDALSEGVTNLYFTDIRVDERVLELLVEGSGISIVENTDGTLTISATGGGGGASALADLDDVTISSVGDGELLVYDSGGSDWINQTLAEAGVSAVGHSHAASDITSGTFADARISQSSVTQHESALTITESQISDLGSYYSSGDTIRAASGSISAPGLSFSSDTDTGLYLASTGNCRLAVAGNDLMTGAHNGFFGSLTFSAGVVSMTSTISYVNNSTNAIFGNTGTGTGAKLTLKEGSANGTSGITLQSPNALSANLSLTLPDADGSSGQVLQTNGSGVLSFDDVVEGALDSGVTTKLNLAVGQFTLQTVVNDSFWLLNRVPLDLTITKAYAETASGTCDITILINGTAITGMDTVGASSTQATLTATAGNSASVGDVLTLEITNNVDAVMLGITLEGVLD